MRKELQEAEMALRPKCESDAEGERDGSLSKRVLRKLRTMQSKETSASLLGTP